MNATREIPTLVLVKVKVIRGMSWSMHGTRAQGRFQSVNKKRERNRNIGAKRSK
jgi:hypothetical protein